MTAAPKTLSHGEEYDCVLAMCKVYDKEEAAQMGEPDPWEDGGEDDDQFREDRLFMMHCAFEVAKEHFERRMNERIGRAFCRGYNQAVAAAAKETRDAALAFGYVEVNE